MVERRNSEKFGLEQQFAGDYVLARPAPLPPSHDHWGLWRSALAGAAAAAFGLVLGLGTPGLDMSVSGTRIRALDSQPMAARPARPGLSSELLSTSDSDKPDSKAERLKARKEAAKAKLEAARERRATASQARREAAAARKEAAKAKHDAAHERYAAAAQARREAAEARKEAAKAKREAAHARSSSGADARREAAEARKEAAKAKREAAHARYAAAMQARREAAEDKKDAAKAKREAAHERYVAAQQAKREAVEERKRAALQQKEAAKERKAAEVAERESVAAPESNSFGGGAGVAPATGTLLRINSLPWAQVYVDGHMVGNTPLRGFSVTPGEHEVRLVNPTFDMGKLFRVKVARGQQVTRGVLLEE